MFERQWFGKQNIVRLSAEDKKLRQLISLKDYQSAALLANQIYGSSEWGIHMCDLINSSARSSAHNKKHVSLAFSGFWDSFPYANNPILSLFKAATVTSKISIELAKDNNILNADIVILGCYASPKCKLPSSTLRISYLPEPVVPDYSIFDFSISQFKSSCQGLNIYLPLFLFELHAGFVESSYPDRCEQPISPSHVYFGLHDQQIPPKDFCIIMGNANPMRVSLVEALRLNGFAVDCYGHAYNRPLSSKEQIQMNQEIKTKYTTF